MPFPRRSRDRELGPGPIRRALQRGIRDRMPALRRGSRAALGPGPTR
jgi:hypothetical protein